MRALIAVPDLGRRLLQCTFDALNHEGHLQRLVQFPGYGIAREPVDDRHQIEPAAEEPDVCDVNGLLTNDKFCLIRTEKLQLRKMRSFHHSPVTTV